jgi:macrolide-specific efflux system membrane fusion protein
MSNTVLRRLLIVFGALAVLAVVAFGPGVYTNLTKKKPPAPPLATVSRTSFPVVAQASGTLFPANLMYVNFGVGGVLNEVDAKVGQTVTAGQKLAQVDQTAQRAALAAASAGVSAAYAALSTAQASGNGQQIAAAEAQVAGAQQQLLKAETDVNATVLAAPEAATVLQVNSQVGQSVTAGVTRAPSVAGSTSPIIDPNQAGTAAATAFIVLGTANQYQVSAAFSEASASELAAGQTASVSFDAVTGLTLPGTVSAVASSATQVNGVPEYYAAITAPSSDPRLRSGMTVTVNVDIAQANNVISVPSQAVFTLSNGQFVNVWYKGAAVPVQVTTGLIGEQRIQITSGLTVGEQVELAVGATIPSALPSPT